MQSQHYEDFDVIMRLLQEGKQAYETGDLQGWINKYDDEDQLEIIFNVVEVYDINADTLFDDGKYASCVAEIKRILGMDGGGDISDANDDDNGDEYVPSDEDKDI